MDPLSVREVFLAQVRASRLPRATIALELLHGRCPEGYSPEKSVAVLVWAMLPSAFTEAEVLQCLRDSGWRVDDEIVARLRVVYEATISPPAGES